MRILLRTGLVTFGLSLASLAACSSDKKADPAGGTAGATTLGTGGTPGTVTGGAPGVGTGGASATGGSASPATGGSATATTNIKAADGGTITADGLKLTIPPGALMADTNITVGVSDGAALPGASTLVAKVYELGPTGTMFLKPVALTIDFDTTKLVSPKVATVAFLEGQAWVALAGSFTTGAKATATTTHFTPFSVVSTDPVVNNCVAMGPGACQICCKETYPSGEAKVIPSIFETCACAAGALCNAQCATNACMGMAITTECKACIDAETGKTQSDCFDQGLIACGKSSDCADYFTCTASCQ